jgi:hypothetical protein
MNLYRHILHVAAFLATSSLCAAAIAAPASRLDNSKPDPGKVFAFYAFDDPFSITEATDVDNTGTVVGSYSNDTIHQGFIRKINGQFLPLDIVVPGSTTGTTLPRAISELGTIVGTDGSGNAPQYSYHSWLYQIKTGTVEEIAYPGAFATLAWDMNESGMVAGWATLGGDFGSEIRPAVGFTWRNGVFKPISIAGAYSTYVRSVNKSGQLSGEYWLKRTDGTGYDRKKFIMDVDGGVEVVDPRYPSNTGGPWEIETLGNNGDYAGGCISGEVVHDICYHVEATGQTAVIEFGPDSGCDSLFIGIGSIKTHLTAGSCGNSFGGSAGFVATRKALLSNIVLTNP